MAQQYATTVGQLPNTVMVVLDKGLARQAAALGSKHELRGADAVYLASAALFAAELVTLDHEQLMCGAAIVHADSCRLPDNDPIVGISLVYHLPEERISRKHKLSLS